MPGGETRAIQRDKTAAENLAMFAKELPLEFEPGTKYLYSN